MEWPQSLGLAGSLALTDQPSLLPGIGVPYELKEHRFTERISVRVKPGGQVIVAAGRRVSRRRLDEFLRSQSRWIDRTRVKMQEYGRQFSPFPYQEGNTLTLFNATHQIAFEPKKRGRPACRIDGDRLVVAVREPEAADRRTLVRRGIRLWTGARMVNEIRPDMERWARRLDVQPERLRVGDQRSEWGACSHRGTISLNWRLALTPSPITEYVLVHELCHLRHHNHSDRFWRMVDAALPEAQSRRAWLRRASHWLMTY